MGVIPMNCFHSLRFRASATVIDFAAVTSAAAAATGAAAGAVAAAEFSFARRCGVGRPMLVRSSGAHAAAESAPRCFLFVLHRFRRSGCFPVSPFCRVSRAILASSSFLARRASSGVGWYAERREPLLFFFSLSSSSASPVAKGWCWLGVGNVIHFGS